MIKRIVIIVIFLLVIVVSVDATTHGTTFENPLQAATFLELINSLIDYLFWLAVILLPLMIMTSAFFFLTGGGSPDQVTKAKNILIYSFIGFIIMASARGIVEFLVDRLTI